ncbi:MAG: hypothetical protein NTW14_08065 [bacterium]|nr:hypothetical protein [bacterium]
MKNFTVVSIMIISLLVFSAGLGQAQVWEEWVSTYNGPASGSDAANCLTLDGDGGIYVSGSSEGGASTSDIATIMYSPTGAEYWVDRYDGTAHGPDAPHAIIVDEMVYGDDYRYVYVTGYSTGNQKDCITLKYNSSGERLWALRYDGGDHLDDEANAMARGGAGTICIAGYSTSVQSGRDFVTIKYSQPGVQLWAAQYNGSSNGDDEATCIGTDGAGNVYVGGKSDRDPDPGVTNFDLVVVKYNSSGTQQWETRYNGAFDSEDKATAMVVDFDGNVWVTGTTFASSTGPDFITIKYNTAGIEQWQQIYDGGGDDEAAAIAKDVVGNVYVAGESQRPGTDTDFVTIMYNYDGVQHWVAYYDYSGNWDSANSIAVDANQGIYVTGASEGTTVDYATVKYNSSGVEQWAVRFDGAGHGSDLAAVVKLAGNGQLFVTGSSEGVGTSSDYCTIKYAETGPPTPVQLSTFSGQAIDHSVELVWQTASEIDCYGWKVERRLQENPYLDVSELIPGHGTTPEPQEYSFRDETAQAGEIYTYRLEQIDLNGNTTFSEPITVTVDVQPTEFVFRGIYPNPFNPTATIRFDLQQASWMTLEVFDVDGRCVGAHGMRPIVGGVGSQGALRAPLQETWFPAGTHTILFDGSDLPSGLYFARLTTGNWSAMQKLVLLK